MRMRTLVCLILGSAATILLGACAATGITPVEAVNPKGGEMIQPAAESPSPVYRFYPGDEISVRAVNRPELTVASLRVDPYGYIAYPYLGQVYVKNLTPQEVAERLTRGLKEGDYYKRAELSVSFVASKEQYVYVMGEVKKPGPVAISGSITLLDALGKAEGKTYDAEMSTVLWIRGSWSPPGVVKLDLSSLGDPRSSNPEIPNLRLIPGDVIYVPDQAIVSVQRFFNRMYDIFRAVVALETSVILYDGVERVFSGRYPPVGTSGQTIIVLPGK